MQEKDELLSKLSLTDILLNYSDALNNIWKNLTKIKLIAYDDWDEFLNDFWNHLVIKTLCWKYGLTKDELGIATEISGVGISSGKSKIIAELKGNEVSCWTFENDKTQLRADGILRLELVDITTIGVNLTMPLNAVFSDLSEYKNELSFCFPLTNSENMNFDFAKIEVTDSNHVKSRLYFKLIDLDFELEKK